MRETLNGQPIYVSDNGSTLFIPIPVELAAPIGNTCGCPYCKAHPDEEPMWDALAIAAKPNTKGGGEHTWTVHFPGLRDGSHGLGMYGWRKSAQ
jgi:hypothetical protein